MIGVNELMILALAMALLMIARQFFRAIGSLLDDVDRKADADHVRHNERLVNEIRDRVMRMPAMDEVIGRDEFQETVRQIVWEMIENRSGPAGRIMPKNAGSIHLEVNAGKAAKITMYSQSGEDEPEEMQIEVDADRAAGITEMAISSIYTNPARFNELLKKLKDEARNESN